jgi:hypothetical protein
MRDEPFLMNVGDAVSSAAVNDAILRSVASGRVEPVERVEQPDANGLPGV